jgi:hypothetical protein
VEGAAAAFGLGGGEGDDFDARGSEVGAEGAEGGVIEGLEEAPANRDEHVSGEMEGVDDRGAAVSGE